MSFDIKFTRQGFRECLLTSRGLRSDSTCVFEEEPGKLNIKRGEPRFLFFSLQVDSFFKPTIMMSFLSGVSIQ